MGSQNDMKKIAEQLAEKHAEIEPTVERIYWFPATDEIRLVELDSATMESEKIEAFYFTPDPTEGVPFRSAVAVIRTEEKNKLEPPEEWGSWDDAELIWPRT